MISLRSFGLAAALALVLAGCLPTCRREEDKRLTPADSAGRLASLAVVPDTLIPLWTRDARTMPGLEYPRTVRFMPASGALGGSVVVADPATGDLWTIGAGGSPARRHVLGLSGPYLAGFRGDSVVVYEVGVNRFSIVAADSAGALRVARRVPFTGLPSDQTLVRYGAAWMDGFAVKYSSEESGAGLLVLDASGRVRHRERLAGPHWRFAGPLRTSGDTLVSVCGFRPVIDRFTASVDSSGAASGAASRLVIRRDSVALVGFDSPMLARSRRFLTGDVSSPPLLLPSAAVLGAGEIVALNLRLGWIEADRYGPDGLLRGRIVERLVFLNPDVLPDDLDARRLADGSLEIAVAVPRPRGRIVAFRWR